MLHRLTGPQIPEAGATNSPSYIPRSYSAEISYVCPTMLHKTRCLDRCLDIPSATRVACLWIKTMLPWHHTYFRVIRFIRCKHMLHKLHTYVDFQFLPPIFTPWRLAQWSVGMATTHIIHSPPGRAAFSLVLSPQTKQTDWSLAPPKSSTLCINPKHETCRTWNSGGSQRRCGGVDPRPLDHRGRPVSSFTPRLVVSS